MIKKLLIASYLMLHSVCSYGSFNSDGSPKRLELECWYDFIEYKGNGIYAFYQIRLKGHTLKPAVDKKYDTYYWVDFSESLSKINLTQGPNYDIIYDIPTYYCKELK